MLERRLELVNAQLVLASLAALEGPTAAAGAEALAELAQAVACIAYSGDWRIGWRPAPTGREESLPE